MFRPEVNKFGNKHTCKTFKLLNFFIVFLWQLKFHTFNFDLNAKRIAYEYLYVYNPQQLKNLHKSHTNLTIALTTR